MCPRELLAPALAADKTLAPIALNSLRLERTMTAHLGSMDFNCNSNRCMHYTLNNERNPRTFPASLTAAAYQLAQAAGQGPAFIASIANSPNLVAVLRGCQSPQLAVACLLASGGPWLHRGLTWYCGLGGRQSMIGGRG